METLKRWILFGVILVSGLILILLAILYFSSAAREIKNEKQEHLSAVNNLKIDQIVQWRKERISTAKFFPTIDRFIKYTGQLSKNKNNSEAVKYFNKSLLPFKLNHYYENIFITDAAGILLYSLDSSYNEVDKPTILNIKEAINKDSVFFSNFYYNNNEKIVCFDLISPVKDDNGFVIGTIIQRANPIYRLFPLVKKWPNVNKSFETVLFRKEKEKLIFLTDLRYKVNSALKLSISLNDTGSVFVKGALGTRGITEGKDYRGTDVLADLNEIPGTDWIIASTVDKSEIYSNIIISGKATIIIIIASVLSLVLGILYLYKSRQSRIYKNLFMKEKKFLEMQKEYRTILYSIGDAVITTDNSGSIKQMNEVAETLTGWKESEARGKILNEVFKIINEKTRREVETPVQKVLNEGKLVSLANHTLLISRRGIEIPIADSGSPIKDEAGNIIGVVLVFRDMTEERAKEKILVENEERLRLSLYAANQGLYDLNIQTGMAIVNDEYSSMLGYDPKTFVETNFFWIERLHPDDKEKTAKAYQEYIDGKTNEYKVEFRQKTKTGGWKWILSLGKIVEYDNKGNPLRMLGTHTDITERRQAEEELKESEIRFRALAECSPVGIFRTDSFGKTIYVNPRWCEISRLSFEQALGDGWLDAVHPDDKNTLGEVWKSAAASMVSSKAEYRFLSKEGDITWVLGYAVPVKNNLESIIGYIGTIIDITDRKRAEEALRKSDELLTASVKVSKIGIFNHDHLNNIVYWSPRHREIYEWALDEPVTLQSILSYIHPDDKEWFRETIKQAHDPAGNGLWEVEYRIIKRDGEIRWLSAKSQTFFEGEGISRHPLRTVGATLDITQAKLIERNLRSLSRAVEQSPVSTIITNTKGNIEFVNPKFTELTGYTFEEVKGKNPRILKSDNTTSDEYKFLWKSIIENKEWRGELLNKKKNGELYWVSAYISPILNEAGETINFIALEEDITDRKKIIIELTEAKEKAEEMNRLKSSFFANMSHELRTPFMGILGFAELLEGTLINPEEKEFASHILKSSKRLTQTLNRILDISRLEYARPVLNLTDIDVNELVVETGELFVQYAKVHNTVIKINPEFVNRKIKFDEKLLGEILTNLINNAVKFTHNGIIEITSKKIIVNKKDFLEITVADNGIGIPEEKQAIIWHEFRQASEGYNRSFEGTGLGLSITKKYVDFLKGQIHLKSKEGEGSVFTVCLPVTFSDNNYKEDEMISDNNEIFSENIISTRKKLLIVEDDAITLQYLAKVLSHSYDVETAVNAITALELVNKTCYDAFLLDINLGKGLDGVELMKEIKKIKNYENTPFIAVTAFAAESDMHEFLSKGFTNYISKPFLFTELNELLKGIFS